MNQTEVPDTQVADGGRPPEGLVETVTANCRPQPAIPGVLVLMLTLLLPVMSQDPQASGPSESLLMWAVPVGILASCGLAIAAGFCSFFPQLAWIGLATWGMKFTAAGGPLPAYNRWVLVAGMVAATLMLGVQLWRVITRRFVPTIVDADDDLDTTE